MKISLTIFSTNADTKAKAYEGISNKLKAINALIDVDMQDDIDSLADLIVSHGSTYNKVVIVNLIKNDNKAIFENAVEKILSISKALSPNQNVTIFDRLESTPFATYVADSCIMESNIQYKQIEKMTPSYVASNLFGKDKVDTSSAVSEIRNIIEQERKAIDDTPIEITEDDIEDIPEEIEEVPEETKNKKPGFFNRFKKPKSKDVGTEDSIEESEVVVDEVNDDDENSEESIEEIIEIVEEDTDIEDTPKKHGIFNMKKSEPSNSGDKKSKFPFKKKTEKPVTASEPISSPVEPTPVPLPNVVDPFEGSGEEEEEDDFDDIFMREVVPESPSNTSETIAESIAKPKKRGLFGGVKSEYAQEAKSKAKKYDKEQLSMVRKSKIIGVTGAGRRGVSTIAASLGFVGAERMCNTLIIDLDMIKRSQSCIFDNTENSYAPSITSGLGGAVDSPHLIPQFAYESLTRLSTLGIDISCEYNRSYYNSITSQQIKTVLMSALTNYNLVIVDIPWDYLCSHADIASTFHELVYVSSNDMMTIISDANIFEENSFDNAVDYKIIMSKLSFVLNMVCPENSDDRRKITKKNFTDILCELTDDEEWHYHNVIDEIPIISNIGNQASVRKPAASFSQEMNDHCTEILYKLSDRI